MNEEERARRFAEAARAYCEWFVARSSLPPDEQLFSSARRHLAVLVALACDLPEGDANDVGDEDPDAVAPPSEQSSPSIDFGPSDIYWVASDPYAHDLEGQETTKSGLGAGSLADDTADIYRDLKRGLFYWEKGAISASVWEWRFGFCAHWGNHAVDALRALHRLCAHQAACPTSAPLSVYDV